MSLPVQSIKAASELTDGITPYQVITMLLNGALERIDQAMISLDGGDLDEANTLVGKTIGIVGGLRQSLDTKMGGELANNLDMLYEYIVVQLNTIDNYDEPVTILEEVRKLLSEVYSGWVEIEAKVSITG